MFFVGQNNRETATKLAKRCRGKCGVEPENTSDFIINYGGKYKKANLNKKIRFNKLKAHKRLAKNEILVPRMFLPNQTIPSECFPMLARKKYHARGEDIVFINELKNLKNKEYDYLVQFIPSKAEYRAHVLDNNIVSVTKKLPKKNIVLSSDTIRCLENGWVQKEYRGLRRKKIADLAIKAKNVLCYDFGAVDILVGKDNKYYVLEVNSGPKLNKKRRILYAEYFKRKEAEWLKEKNNKG